ncbi:MAG: anthranilate synthase component I family protein [Kiritimatiellae bacterium]|nr:anthranilate synthase component I family protein [Kiritimatiellia bacterium]
MLRVCSRELFEERTAGGRKTPVWREFLADRETPVSVLGRLAEDDNVFLLESVYNAINRGRYSFFGLDPKAVLTEKDGFVAVMKPGVAAPEILPEKTALEAMRRIFAEEPFEPAPELPPMQGGAIGFLSYDAIKIFEPRVGLVADKDTPQACFMLTDRLVIFDNARQTMLVMVVADAKTGYDAAMRGIDAIYKRITGPEPAPSPIPSEPYVADGAPVPDADFTSEMTFDEYREMVLKCKQAIFDGECIQMVPSQKFTVDTKARPIQLYRALRLINPSPYNFFMKFSGRCLIGSSPEELVKMTNRTASTCPIAGTKPRGKTQEEDLRLEEILTHDEKELAEHTMLVDLGRNDLGRVCKTGTVKVDKFAYVERYSHVMHLVSHVSGTLEDGMDMFDLLRVTFPAGTLTGAPKIRAMELIAEYEKSPRGVYGGTAGYFSYTGDMDFAIMIRTMERIGRRLMMRSGGGIVADSVVENEYWETINKARAIFNAAKFAENI